jgi:hypothetical protein
VQEHFRDIQNGACFASSIDPGESGTFFIIQKSRKRHLVEEVVPHRAFISGLSLMIECAILL